MNSLFWKVANIIAEILPKKINKFKISFINNVYSFKERLIKYADQTFWFNQRIYENMVLNDFKLITKTVEIFVTFALCGESQFIIGCKYQSRGWTLHYL